MRLIMQLKNGTKGQGLVEYGLILALVSVVAVGALNGVGNKVSSTFNKVGDAETLAKIEEGYIPVASAEELDSLRNKSEQSFGLGTNWEGTYLSGLDKKYIQVADIDLVGFVNWDPIGTFTGDYDGGGHSISNLKIDRGNRAGLFGSVQNGKIESVHLHNVSVYGRDDVGGLVGHSDNSFINDSSVSGVVDASRFRVGGLVGFSFSSTIVNSLSSANVTGDINVGGLAGGNSDNALIDSSYATGSVSGVSRVGGLVGLNYVSSTITNGYATGNAEGSVDIGGLVGRNGGGYISDSRWANDVCLIGIGSSKKLERTLVDGTSENVMGQPKSEIDSILSRFVR